MSELLQKIISVASKKGGVGKTTTAVNIAMHFTLKGKKVCLVDSDEKCDSVDWIMLRKENYPDLPRPDIKRALGDIDVFIEALAKRYDYVIVDCGGYDGEEMEAALLESDYFLAPFAPTRIDTKSARSIEKKIKSAKKLNNKLQAFSFFVKCPTNYLSKRTKKFTEELSSYEHLQFIKARTKHLDSWMISTDEGLAIEELDDSQAKAQLQLIIKDTING